MSDWQNILKLFRSTSQAEDLKEKHSSESTHSSGCDEKILCTIKKHGQGNHCGSTVLREHSTSLQALKKTYPQKIVGLLWNKIRKIISSFLPKAVPVNRSLQLHEVIVDLHQLYDSLQKTLKFNGKRRSKNSKNPQITYMHHSKTMTMNSDRPGYSHYQDVFPCKSKSIDSETQQYDDEKFMLTGSPKFIKIKLSKICYRLNDLDTSVLWEETIALMDENQASCARLLDTTSSGEQPASTVVFDEAVYNPENEQFIHNTSPMATLLHTLQSFFDVNVSVFKEKDKQFEDVVDEFNAKFKKACYNVFNFKYEKAAKDEYARKGFIAYHIVGSYSLAELRMWIKRISVHSSCIDEDVVAMCCCLLNPLHGNIKRFYDNGDASVKVKRKFFKNFLDDLFKQYILSQKRDQCRLFFLFCCALELSHEILLSAIEKLSQFHESKVFSWPYDHDGSIYDRARDPPGQRSVYIPPGDTNAESYRLSTYIKFPRDSPVSSRKLAAAGFFYTGYKDRVKCFSCGLCVENWVIGDDESHSRWHRSDCQMMLNQECGNIAIGSIFGHIGGHGRRTGGQPAAEGPRASASATVSPAPSSSQQNNSSVPAGLLLKHATNTGSSAPAYSQTARPINPPRQIRQNYPRLELASITTSSHQQLIRSLNLNRESDRMRSFGTWPVENITVHPSELARSGFFYLGNLDRVQCFSCSGVLRNWNYGDDVSVEHRRHYPDCRMVRGSEDRNVVLQPNEHVPMPLRRERMQEPPDPSEEEQRDLQDMFPCLYPVNPHMRSEENRFETFDNRWPSNRVDATPQQISRAGFFFLGERDRVKCWYCNGGLQNWDPEDEPWTEHAKWFPTCEFLLQRKGPDFVHRMVSLFPRLPRPMLRGPFDVAPSLGRSGSGQQRRPSPPPPIIDPRAELQRIQEQLSTAMASNWAIAAQGMGFSRAAVERVVKRKLESGGSLYTSVNELLEDLTSPPPADPSDDEENMSGSESSMTVQSTAVKSTSSATSPPSSSAASASAAAGEETSESGGMDTAMETSTMSLPEGMPPSMEERIRELQDERKCKICLDNLADVVFVPCGHLCSCTNCAQALRKCPICREKIEKAIRTYMS